MLIEMICPICRVRYGLEEAYYDYRLLGGLSGNGDGRRAGWRCPNGCYLAMSEDAINEAQLEALENDDSGDAKDGNVVAFPGPDAA